jgi:hypothetical protein
LLQVDSDLRQPIVDILSDLVSAVSVALLQLAFELLTAAVDNFQVIVSELTSLF